MSFSLLSIANRIAAPVEPEVTHRTYKYPKSKPNPSARKPGRLEPRKERIPFRQDPNLKGLYKGVPGGKSKDVPWGGGGSHGIGDPSQKIDDTPIVKIKELEPSNFMTDYGLSYDRSRDLLKVVLETTGSFDLHGLEDYQVSYTGEVRIDTPPVSGEHELTELALKIFEEFKTRPARVKNLTDDSDSEDVHFLTSLRERFWTEVFSEEFVDKLIDGIKFEFRKLRKTAPSFSYEIEKGVEPGSAILTFSLYQEGPVKIREFNKTIVIDKPVTIQTIGNMLPNVEAVTSSGASVKMGGKLFWDKVLRENSIPVDKMVSTINTVQRTSGLTESEKESQVVNLQEKRRDEKIADLLVKYNNAWLGQAGGALAPWRQIVDLIRSIPDPNLPEEERQVQMDRLLEMVGGSNMPGFDDFEAQKDRLQAVLSNIIVSNQVRSDTMKKLNMAKKVRDPKDPTPRHIFEFPKLDSAKK